MPSVNDNKSAEARQLASEIFVLGFPLVLMDVVRRAHPIQLNQILQLADDSSALAPGLADEGIRTVRTSTWIDVREQPVVMHLPHMHGRYFSLTLMGTSGEPFASLGSRTGDDTGCDLAIAGPRWRGELVGRLKARRATGPIVWAVSRITANSAADRPEAEALAARQCLTPLRKGGEPCVAGPVRMLEPPAYASVQQVMKMASDSFRHRLSLLIERAAPGDAQDAGATSIEPRLRLLDDIWRLTDVEPELSRAVTRGFADGAAAIRAGAELASGPAAGGWRTVGASPNLDPAGLARAVRAFTDLGGPGRDDVMSLVCNADEAGRELSGAERYRIHFPRGAAPPVEAFWSLYVAPRAARGGPTGNLRGISDRNDLSANSDGSLDLIIQHDPPGGAQGVNWLPSPTGAFTLNMRLHWPKPAALAGDWRMPPVERLGSGFARRAESRSPTADRKGAAPPSDDLRPVQSAHCCSAYREIAP